MKRISRGAVFSILLSFGSANAALDAPVVEPADVTLAYAEAGDPSAQYNYALRCAKGEGVKQDSAQSLAWYRKAAAAGLPQAQYNLGVLLANGDGIARDEKEATKWFTASGNQGVFEAHKALIQCHALGLGVEKSAPNALAWDLLARRSLELRFQAAGTMPATLSKLRADAAARKATEEAAAAEMRSAGSVAFRVPEPAVMHLAGTPGVFREKVSIDRQLGELERLESASGFFAGVTEAQYETARVAAQRFVFNLPTTPQKVQPENWLNQRLAQMAAPPQPPPLVEIKSDRSDVHPLGLYGRTIIKKHGWKHAETEHFIVHYTQSSDAYPVMRYIECAYFVATQTLQIDTAASKRKSHVFIFPDSATWQLFTETVRLPSTVAGFAYKGELLLGAHEEKDTYLKVLCHEATHAIVSHFYPGRQWPLWLNEGFAEYVSAKSLALRRSHRTERYLATKVSNRIEVQNVFNRTHYGAGGRFGENDVGAFYGEAEKCVRVLLEKLPAQSFPRFGNLVMAGNSIPACLSEAYGKTCDDAAKFQTLLNATP